MTFDDYLKTRFCIVRGFWKEEAFLCGLAKHIGEHHTIREREHYSENWETEYVGFGDESVWRGKFYYDHGKLVAVELIPNSNKSQQDVALATMGLAVLTHNGHARLSDAVVLE